jgi:predicted MFS family arabinose efflux permease
MAVARREYLVIGVLWSLVFVVGSQALIVAPILPQIATQLTVPESALGTLITAYAVTVGVVALLTGPVSDRVGRRRIILAGTALMAVALAAHWAARDFASLLAVRALAGVAGGVLNGAAVAYVGDYFPRDRRGWANGWVFSGMAAGQIAGIPVGAVLAERAGFRLPFVLFGLFMAATVLLVWRYVPQPDVRLSDRLTLASAVDGYRALLARREVLAAVAVFVVMFGGSALYTTYLPTWLAVTYGAGGAAIGTMFLLGGVANVIVGPRAGTLSDAIGRKPPIVAASLGLAILMAATTTLVGGVGAAYVVFFVVMGLFAARATPFQTLMTEMVGGERRGSFLNLTVGLGQVGSGVGGALAGGAYAAVGYGGTTLVAGAAMVVIAVLVWTSLPETSTLEDPDDERATVPGAGTPVDGDAAGNADGVARPPTTATQSARSLPPAIEAPIPGPAPAAATAAPDDGRESWSGGAVVAFACDQACDSLYGPCPEAGYALEKLTERDRRRRDVDEEGR